MIEDYPQPFSFISESFIKYIEQIAREAYYTQIRVGPIQGDMLRAYLGQQDTSDCWPGDGKG